MYSVKETDELSSADVKCMLGIEKQHFVFTVRKKNHRTYALYRYKIHNTLIHVYICINQSKILRSLNLC